MTEVKFIHTFKLLLYTKPFYHLILIIIIVRGHAINFLQITNNNLFPSKLIIRNSEKKKKIPKRRESF